MLLNTQKGIFMDYSPSCLYWLQNPTKEPRTCKQIFHIYTTSCRFITFISYLWYIYMLINTKNLVKAKMSHWWFTSCRSRTGILSIPICRVAATWCTSVVMSVLSYATVHRTGQSGTLKYWTLSSKVPCTLEVKAKLFLCLIKAPHHHGVQWIGGTTSSIRCMWVTNFRPAVILSEESAPITSSKRGWVGPRTDPGVW